VLVSLVQTATHQTVIAAVPTAIRHRSAADIPEKQANVGTTLNPISVKQITARFHTSNRISQDRARL